MKEKTILRSLLVKLLFGVILFGGLLVSPIKMVNAQAAELCVFEKEEYMSDLYSNMPIGDGDSFRIAVLQGEQYTLKPCVIELDNLKMVQVKDATYEWLYGPEGASVADVVSTENSYLFKEDAVGEYFYTCFITYKGETISINYYIKVVTEQDLQKCDKVTPSLISIVPATSSKISPVTEVVAEIGEEGYENNYYLKENVDYKVTFLDKVNPLSDKTIRYKFEYLGNFKDYGVSLDATFSLSFDIKIKDKTVVINSTGANYKPDITYYNVEGEYKWHYYSDAACQKELSTKPKTAGIFYVRASCGDTYSNAATLTILPGTCSVKVAAYTDRAVKLTWTKAKGANYYRVFLKKNGKWQTVKNTPGTSCVVKDLLGFTVNEFAVRPCYVTSSKKILWAKTFTTKKVRTKVSAVDSVKATVDGDWVSLNYRKWWGSADGIQVYLSKNNGKYKLVETTHITVSLYSNLKPGTYKVKARCYCDYKGKRYYGAFSKPTTFKMK